MTNQSFLKWNGRQKVQNMPGVTFRSGNVIRFMMAISILFMMVASPLAAKKIEGLLKNVNFKSIDTAKILVKETGQYFFSKKDGSFEIEVPDELAAVTLEFRNNFYYTNTLRVKMDRDVKKLEVLLVPREHIQEEVTVTALTYEEKTVSVPMAESVVSEVEIKERIAENMVDTLQNTAGVHFIGSGGYPVTPSIRGLARRRLLILLDGARVISDRRAGTSASFISPELINRIEVVRSSSAVLYGSDAIGGVLQMFTQAEPGEDPGKSSLNLQLSSVSDRTGGGFTFAENFGKFNLHTGFQLTHAGNYASPSGEIYNSGYSNYCGVFDLSYHNQQRDFIIGYSGGYDKDVGKPERANNPNKLTTAPRDINHFINIRYNERGLISNGSLNFHMYFNPTIYELETLDNSKGSREYSETTGQNYGFNLHLKKSLGKYFSFLAGVEQYSRRNLDIKNEIRATANDPVNSFYPLENGTRSDTGLYLTFDYSGLRGFDFLGGVRYTFFSLKTKMQGTPQSIEADAPSFFLGVRRELGKSLAIFFNVSQAFRTPSLSEAFYTGITGRRYVIANPNLQSEKSLNLDSGIKFFSKRAFLGLYVFSYRVKDLIERYRVEGDIYTHDNIMEGRIQGGEIECQLFPLQALEVFGHYFYYQGRSKADDQPLNDVPAPRVLLGTKLILKKFWCELNYLHSFKKDDPGPAEVFNEAYNLLDVKAGYYFSANLFIYLRAANLLNETYFANADPDIPEGKKFDLSAGINIYF